MAFQVGPFDLTSPQSQTNLLPTARFRPSEQAVISRIPSSIIRFYTPVAGPDARDVKFLMQLVLTNMPVRNALTACFSAILPAHDSQLGPLNRECFGSALQSVRSQLVDPNPDYDDLSLIQIAIQFLGLLESIGPRQCSDPSTHFTALSMLYGRLARQPRRSPIPRHLRVLMLEACIYHHAQLAPFTFDIGYFDKIWQQSRVYELLLEINPEGENRLGSSQLLSGQYELWAMTYEVHSLSRSAATQRPERAALEQKKQRTRQIQEGLADYFAKSKEAGPAERHSLTENYRIHCIGLLIALTALEDASKERTSEIERLVAEGLQMFLKFKPLKMTYGGLAWPLEIIACAIENPHDWANFETKVSSLKMMLDAGHVKRLESVMNHAEIGRLTHADDATQIDAHDRESLRLPGALHLLQQRIPLDLSSSEG